MKAFRVFSFLGLSLGLFGALLIQVSEVHAQLAPSGVQSNSGTAGYTPTTLGDVLLGLVPSSGTPATAAGNEGTGTSWSLLTDGAFGTVGVVDNTYPVVNSNNNNPTTLIYSLTGAAGGYSLNNIDVYSGWANNGRIFQNWSVYTTSAANPSSTSAWTLQNNISYQPGGSLKSIQVDLAGLVNSVTGLRFVFPTQQNGYVGYREITATGVPTITAAVAASSGVGVFSSAAVGGGNVDALVGISAKKTYINAVNIQGGMVTVNGVPFTGSGGGNSSGTTWSTSNYGNQFGSGGAGIVTGSLGSLIDNFNYGNGTSTQTISVSSLVAGQTYVVTLYNRAWDTDDSVRKQNFSTTSGATTSFNQDIGTTGANVLRYTFVASGASETINIDPQNARSFHLYGFSTEKVFNDAWTGAANTNWNGGNWTATTPNYVGANALFPASTAPASVTLDAPTTVGHLQFDGTNTLTVAGSNTLTLQTDPGGVSVVAPVAGTLTVATPVSMGTGALKLGSGTVNFTNTVTSNGKSLTVSAGLVQFGDGVTSSVSTPFDGPIVNNAAVTFNHPNAQTFSGGLSGNGSLTKTGSGTLTMTGSGDQYTGSVTANAGTVNFVNSSFGTGNIAFTGGALQFAISNAQSLGSRIKNSTSAVTLGTSGPLAAVGPIDNSNTGGLTKTGAGNLVLFNGTSSYSGATTISGGTVTLSSNTSAGTTVPNNSFETSAVGVPGNWSYSPGGSGWTFGGQSGIATPGSPWISGAASIDGTHAAFIQDNGSISETITTPTTGVYNLSYLATNRPDYDAENIAVSIDGVVQNYTPYTVYNGNGVVAGYSFDIPLVAGTHNLKFQGSYASPGVAGADSSMLVDNIVISGYATSGGLPSGTAVNITASGGALNLAGQTQTVGSLAGVAGAMVVNNGALTAGADNSNTLFAGTISGSGAFTKDGAGTMILAGPNTYTGSTTISNGTLQIGNGGASGSIGSSSGVTNNGSIVFSRSDNYGGNFAPAIGGGGDLRLAGGTLSLPALHSYTGATNINSGTLVVSGTGGINTSSQINVNSPGAKYAHTSSLASTVPITVNQGSLDGTGTVGSVSVADAASAGVTNGFGTTGTLTVGSLTFNGAGTATVNDSGVAATPGINVTGALTTGNVNVGGIVTVNVNAPPAFLWANNTTYNLIGFGSLLGAGSSDFALGAVTALGARQTSSLGYTGSFVTLTITGNTPYWKGSDSNNWVTGATGPLTNWVLKPSGGTANFIANDSVVLDDTATTGLVNISGASVSPTSATFNNNALSYTLTSSSGNGIATGYVTKSGTGTLTMAATGNTYSGGTFIQGGKIALGTNNGLPSGGPVSFGLNSSSGTLNLAGFSQTVGLLSVGAGAAPASQVITSSVPNGTLNFAAPGQYSSFTGTIQDAAGLTVSSGTLDTTGGSTVYSGPTNVVGGQLVAGSLPSIGGIFVGPSGSLYFPGVNASEPALTNSGNVSFAAGSGTATVVSLSGPGTTTFADGASVGSAVSGTENFNGATAAITNLTNANLNVSINTALGIAAGSQTTGSINGAGSVTITGPGLVSLAGTNTNTGGTTVSGGTLQYGTANTLLTTGAATVNGGGAVLDLGGFSSSLGTLNLNNGTVQNGTVNASLVNLQSGLISATLAGAGSVTMSGSGTAVLSASNTYSGSTAISGGLLKLGNQAGVPDNTAVNLTGGTLDLSGFNKTFNQVATFGTSGSITNSGTTASTLSLAPSGANMALNSLVQDGANPVALSVSSYGGSSGFNLNVSNSANSFTGGSTISNASVRMLGTNANTALGTGTITISNSGFLMIWANTGSYTNSVVTVGNNFVLNTIGGAQVAAYAGASPNGAPGSKAAIFTDGAGGGSPLTILTGSISLAANGGVDAFASNALYISGPISGTGALYKGIDGTNGGGTVTLSNTANSYSGGTVINSGVLAITADAVLGSGGVTFARSSTLQSASDSISLNAGRSVSIASTTGGVTGTVDTQGFTTTIAGQISGSGTLRKIGSGTLVLGNSANSFGSAAFGMILANGVVKLGPGANISTANNFGIPVTTSGGTLDLNGATGTNAQVGNLSGTGAVINSNSSAVATLSVGGNNANSGPFAGTLTNGAGSLALKKVGTGLAILTGANNSYTGATTVSAGTLALGRLSTGQVAHSTLNGVLTDSTSNANDATAIGFPSYTVGVQPTTQAISLDGSTQYLTIPYSSSLNVSGAFTVSIWQQGATSQSPALLSTRNGGDTTFDLQITPTGLHADIGNGGGWLNTAANANVAIGSGWNMVTYTFNTTGYSIFFNGNQVGSGGYTGTPLFMKAGEELSIGSQKAGGGSYGDNGYYGGNLAEFSLFNSVLSASQIATLYNQGNGSMVLPAASPLVLASSATLDLVGINQTVASLSNATSAGGSIVNSTVSTPVTITLNTSGTATFSGSIGGDTAANSIGLTMSGSGTQLLVGTNSYHGLTLVNGTGTLILSGTGTNAAGETVNSGTLILASNTAVADGSSLTVGPGGTLVFDSQAASPAPVVAPEGVAAVPEPSTLVLFGAALCSAAVYRRLRLRRRKQ